MNATFFAQIFNFLIMIAFISGIYFTIRFLKDLRNRVNSIEKKLDEQSKKQ